MIRPTRTSLSANLAASLLCLGLIGLLLAAPAAAAEATATTAAAGTTTTGGAVIVYKPESYAEYKAQLAADQIASVTINKRVRSLRITLKDGRTHLAKYGPHERPAVESALKAKNVKVAILTPTAAKQEEKAKPAHHKIRYIAGGILLVVVIVVGAVLLINRRRRRAADY